MFKVGDKVYWSSQSRGFDTDKVGEVVAIVPAGQHIRPVRFVETYNVSAMGYGCPRDHESYLVAVQTGKTPQAKKSLYWPRVKSLHIFKGSL